MTHSHPALAERRLSTWRRASILAVLCVVLAVIATSSRLHAFLLAVLTAAGEIIAANPGWGATAFVLLSAAAAMLAFFSTGVLVPVAVITWNETVTFALLWLGWMLGGAFAYAMGRFLGRQVVTTLTSGRGLAYAGRISRAAPFGLVLLFQLGLPSEIPGYVLGLVGYSFAKYLLALGLAELPYAIATVYLGVSFLEQRTLVVAVLGVLVVLFGAWAFQTLHRRLTALGRDAP